MAEDYTQRATCECYYKFENASDLGEDNQNQIDLTNSGAVQSSDIPSGTYASPSAQKSADFEASESDRMYASHAESAEIDNIGALTILLWYKRESFDTSHYMISKQTAIGDGFLLAHEKDGTNNYFMGYIEDGTHDVLRTINADKWYFQALTYNGQWLRLYEGDEETQVVQVAQKNIGSKTIDTDGDFYIGRYAVGSNYVDGKLCEVAIFSEALALSDLQDIQQYGIEGTAGEALIRIINEALQLNEGTPRLMKMVRIKGETLQLNEGIIKVRDLVRIIGETLQINEGIVRFRKMLRQIDETLQINENIIRLKKMVRQINETLQLSETIGKVLGFVRVVNETLQINEGIVRLTGLLRWIDEALQINEGIIRARNLIRVINETLQLNETIVRARNLIRVISESLSLQENVTRLKKMIRVIDETVQINEVIVKIMGFVKVINETLNIQENIVKKIGVIKAILTKIFLDTYIVTSKSFDVCIQKTKELITYIRKKFEG